MAAAQEHAHHASGHPAEARLEFFDDSTAADVAAIASQILPSDDGPGASEAGVIFFIDRALTTFDADKPDLYRNGVREVREKVRSMFSDAKGIAALPAGQQIELLRSIEKSEFSARQQPTATIQALAYRAADHMTRAAKNGELGPA
jgi:hypothetical protein